MVEREEKVVSKEIVLLVATLSSFLVPFIGSSINVALPSIAKTFSISTLTLSWVALSYLLTTSMFLIPFGKLADIYGRRKIFLYGVSLYSFASLLATVSISASMLIFSRVLQGIGASMMFGTSVALISSVFPEKERGRALGITSIGTYLGLSLGPFIGGFLTQHLGWRSIFLVNVVIAVVIIPLVLWRLKGEWTGSSNEKFDIIGSIIYSIFILALMYGFSVVSSPIGFPLIILGLIFLVLFVWWESKVTDPVLDTRLFMSNRVFAFSSLATLINYSATFAVGFVLSLYLQYIKALSPQVAGIILTSQPLMMVIVSPNAGRLSDRIEPQIIASLGMFITTTALFMLFLLNLQSPIWYVILSTSTLGLGLGSFASPNTNAVMGSVEKRYYGVASATLGTMRVLGQTSSMAIATMILNIYNGKTKSIGKNPLLFINAMKTIFLIFAVLCFIGIFLSLARGKTKEFTNKTA